MFSTYTMAVMFICAVSSAASFGAYLLIRNRTYMFAASGFFLFFSTRSLFSRWRISVMGAHYPRTALWHPISLL